jgi:hypothetical protein
MIHLRLIPIVLAAGLITSCSSDSSTPEALPSTPETSVSPSTIPSASISAPVAQLGLDLDPVPYFFAPLDATGQDLPDWMSQLSTIQKSQSVSAEYAALGVSSVVSVNYAPAQGESLSLFTVFYMPEEVYADFQSMEGPSDFGSPLFNSDGKIVSVAGPQGELFEHGSIDQETINKIVDLIYNQQSYQPKIN